MRTSSIYLLGAAALMLTTGMPAAVPAFADPVYTADKLVAIFAQDKAASAAAKTLHKTRKLCFETDPCWKAAGEQPAEQAQARVDLYVNFEFDSDKLTAQAKTNLEQFAIALKDPKIKGTKFEIDGHTDATGTEVYNIGLSERRAAAVVAYLVSMGVDSDTLSAKGYGKEKPRVPDPFSAENRRVETHLQD